MVFKSLVGFQVFSLNESPSEKEGKLVLFGWRSSSLHLPQ